METEHDQILGSVAQVKIADQIGDSGEGDDVRVSCFTEVSDDVTLQFQIIRLAKQVPANNLALIILPTCQVLDLHRDLNRTADLCMGRL